jgi:histidinol phosphatase-like PHP family hydrolase
MKSNIFQGRYLFHFHTSLTDGRLSVKDYFEFAVRDGADSLIFLEHIRRKPTYDVDGLLAETKQLARASGIRTFFGFEAKLLPRGRLDIDDQSLEKADLIGIAEHGFPDNHDLLKSSFLRVLERYAQRIPDKTFVWVHPGLWFQKRGIDPVENAFYWDMLRNAQDSGVMIERNLRHRLIHEKALPRISRDSIVVGVDAHTLQDLEAWHTRQ